MTKTAYRQKFLPSVEEELQDTAIEQISEALLLECNVVVAHPEKLWPAILSVCRAYHERAMEAGL